MSFTPWRRREDAPHTLLQIAQEHYVGGRISFVGSAHFPAQAAMQQCIELGAKALLKAKDPNRTFRGPAGHRLRTLLTEAAETHSSLQALLTDAETAGLIGVLDDGYNPIRYGEGVLGVQLGSTLRAFDTIAWILLAQAGRVLGYEKPLNLRMGERVVPIFLWRLGLPVAEVIRRPCSGEAAEWATVEVVIESPSHSPAT
jgi:hypothetical protein